MVAATAISTQWATPWQSSVRVVYKRQGQKRQVQDHIFECRTVKNFLAASRTADSGSLRGPRRPHDIEPRKMKSSSLSSRMRLKKRIQRIFRADVHHHSPRSSPFPLPTEQSSHPRTPRAPWSPAVHLPLLVVSFREAGHRHTFPITVEAHHCSSQKEDYTQSRIEAGLRGCRRRPTRSM